jgi:hypothetical protein
MSAHLYIETLKIELGTNIDFLIAFLRRAELDGCRLHVFAQEVPTPDAEHLSSWLIDAAAVGAILLVFLKIIDHFKRRPSLEQELEKLLKQIRSELNQLRHEQSTHLSEVRSRVEGAHQRVDLLTHDLNNKLQRLPGEIVDLLHKTGVTGRRNES